MAFSIAIIGRPNVGKSTLFNRLVGKRLALVDDTPGVTRDLREGDGRLRDLRFTVIDTAGLEEATDNSLQGRMRRLTEQAIDSADVSLFIIDARAGITSAGAIGARHMSDDTRAGFVALIGEPNAGKSTLVNRILGTDKMLTGPEAGITRDAIGTVHDWAGTPVKLFDTAGMRKRAKVTAKLEKLSVSDGVRAVKFSEVVVVLLDAQNPLESQDLRIADLSEREGRAVVIAINKWDLVEEKQKTMAALKESVTRLLPQLRGVPLVMLSAKDGKNIDRLHDAVMKAHEIWNARVSTSRLNDWLIQMVARHPPPAPGGRRIKLRYMTQAKTRPPTFVAFCSRPEEVPAAYRRYLVNGMREDFGLQGTPLRLFLRKRDNPFEPGKKKT